jgi:hypothetical protein
VRDAIVRGLVESTSFDAKKELPRPNRNSDLAADVAAMANDGGVLLYGVGEDENGRPTVDNPIPLVGVRERVDQIVQSGISSPSPVDIVELPLEEDPSTGYLVVVVPASPAAPHMVLVGGEHRYYGRTATGNVRLGEGDVAPRNVRARDNGFMHAIARPAIPQECHRAGRRGPGCP